MSTPHPTAEQIDRYRRRNASPDELILVDAHVAGCDRCHAALGAGDADNIVVTLPGTSPGEKSEHLSYDEMERWIDGRLSDVERELVEGHIAECGPCRDELADLDRASKDLQLAPNPPGEVRPRRLRRLVLEAAAVLAVVMAGAWFLLRNESAAPSRDPVGPTIVKKPPAAAQPQSQRLPDALQAHLDEVKRSGKLTRPEILAILSPGAVALRGSESSGAVFSLVEPIGTVIRDSRPQFRWTPVPGASSYSVAVLDVEKDDVAAGGSTERPYWRPAEPLARGRTYSWQVTALREGQAIAAPRPPAPEALFGVASWDQIEELKAWQDRLPADHLDLGILLAEQGLLDDAERELQRAARGGEARASDFLAQLKSWRVEK